MEDQCRLCGKQSELQQSHLFPRFVSNWQKKTGTGYFRRPKNPNLRQQDGITLPLLCSDCERLFSREEHWFSEHVFYPYIDEEKGSFEYDEHLPRFLISVLWRILAVSLPGLRLAQHRFRPLLEEAEVEWREYLLQGGEPRRFPGLHLFFTDIGTEGGIQPSVNFSRYMARAVDGTVVSNQEECYVYAKFARFLALGEVQRIGTESFEGTQVSFRGGVIALPQALRNGHIGNFIARRSAQIYEMFVTGLSDRQRRRINTRVLSDDELGRLVGSDYARAYLADRAAYKLPEMAGARNVGRNERCPCGSGRKYKQCCGRA